MSSEKLEPVIAAFAPSSTATAPPLSAQLSVTELPDSLDETITRGLWVIHSRIVMGIEASIDGVFSALGDPTRRAIFQRLARGGEQTVGALTRQAGVSQPAVSKHLARLEQAGLVSRRRAGRETHYRARAEGLAPLVGWMSAHAAFWRERLDALEELLGRMDT